jgi:hypothetical protein
LGPKKRVSRQLRKKEKKILKKGKGRKTSRNSKVFFIICDIVALPHHDISHSNFIIRKYYYNKEEVKMENERI